MSYERQRTVFDGEEVIRRYDQEERDPTKGVLTYQVDPDDKASPATKHYDGQETTNREMLELLHNILDQLMIMNSYNSIVHEFEVDTSMTEHLK